VKLLDVTIHEYPPFNQVLASAKEGLTMLARGEQWRSFPVAGQDDESQTIEESEQPDVCIPRCETDCARTFPWRPQMSEGEPTESRSASVYSRFRSGIEVWVR
jgi:hypothetical protein